MSMQQGSDATERVNDRAAHMVLVAVGALCMVTFLTLRVPRAQENGLLTSDGIRCFSYLRSVVFDGDLDFRNEFAQLGHAPMRTTPTGLAHNGAAVGPAILWSPFYLSSHVFALMAHEIGVPLDISGYGLVYQSAVSIATMVYVLAGSFLTYAVCRRYFCPCTSLLSVVGIWLASALLHYTVAAPDMAHGLSFFAVSLFVFVWHPPRFRTCGEWILLGLSVGLMALVRHQDVVYASILGVEVIQAVKAGNCRTQRAAILQEYVRGAVLMGLTGALVFVPQLAAWQILFGIPVTIPQGSGIFDWLHPSLLEYLFSTRHGLYTWTPIMLLATIGLVPLWKRDGKVAAALLVALLVHLYVNSAHIYWWAHGSFGARRFVSATPLLALGLAATTEHVAKRFRRGHLIMLGTIGSLVAWNFLFDLQYSWGFIPRDQAISLHELTIGKLEMVVELLGRLVSRL